MTNKWYISRTHDPWKDDYNKPVYFPKAEWFMKHFPWFICRYCYLIIKCREIFRSKKNEKNN